MKTITFEPKGVCCKKITITYEENPDIITDVIFEGGCSGWSKAFRSLVIGLSINGLKHLVEEFKDIKCGKRDTSCPAQLYEFLSQIEIKP